MSGPDFYQDLPILEEFTAVTELAHYQPIPDDWSIVVADVRHSTQAIEKGLYKAVNIIGASVIIGVLNLAKPTAVPFVFGGDGAILCLPPHLAAVVPDTLRTVRNLASQVYGLDLRVGLIPVQAIQQAGYEVRVARLRVSDYYVQAAFTGGGLTYAETLLKDEVQGAAYRFDESFGNDTADFSGLECRWQHIPSPYGETVALLVLATQNSAATNARTYRQLIEQIGQIYGPMRHNHPVAADNMAMSLQTKDLQYEAAVRSYGRSAWGKFKYALYLRLQTLLGMFLVKFSLTMFGTDWSHYKEDVIASSDVRKFDDMIRQILSGTPEQRAALTAYLDEQRQQGKLAYGLHVADSALMTCVIVERTSEHFHLIDGANGGYARAAQALKKQLAGNGD
ncbi:MAG: DUF3095 domain-containing protein [Chloroflexota bacterium]